MSIYGTRSKYDFASLKNVGDTLTGTIIGARDGDVQGKFRKAAVAAQFLDIQPDGDGDPVTLIVASDKGYLVGAISDALEAAGHDPNTYAPEVGAKFQLKLAEKRPTDKGNDANIYVAKYKAPDKPAPALDDDDEEPF
jgi:hypothetical protein